MKRIGAKHAPQHGERARIGKSLRKIEFRVGPRVSTLRVDQTQLVTIRAQAPAHVIFRGGEGRANGASPQLIEVFGPQARDHDNTRTDDLLRRRFESQHGGEPRACAIADSPRAGRGTE